KQFNQLGKVRQGPRQPIDFVDHNDIEPARLDVRQQALQGGAIGRAAGEPAVIISGPYQAPMSVSLAANVSRGGIILSVQRVELLVESRVSRNACVDRTPDCFSRSGHSCTCGGLSRSPKKRGPFHLVPVIARAISDRLL